MSCQVRRIVSVSFRSPARSSLLEYGYAMIIELDLNRSLGSHIAGMANQWHACPQWHNILGTSSIQTCVNGYAFSRTEKQTPIRNHGVGDDLIEEIDEKFDFTVISQSPNFQNTFQKFLGQFCMRQSRDYAVS
ncbi:hypothetical protein TNCV_3050011 [Trichonephila clavipes]|nr:hypothetical protein TNCV_3050011 [Trichonephila clavipes]